MYKVLNLEILLLKSKVVRKHSERVNCRSHDMASGHVLVMRILYLLTLGAHAQRGLQ